MTPSHGLPLPDAPTVTVIIPTVAGREESLARCLAAYRATVPKDRLHIDVRCGFASCGEAWDAGAGIAGTDLVHLSADDLEPLPGWFEATVGSIRDGVLPAPYVRNGHTAALESCGAWGQMILESVDVPMTVIPTFPAAAWRGGCPLAPTPEHLTFDPRRRLASWSSLGLHYFSDNAVSSCARAAGWRIQPRWAYAFLHWWEDAGRKPMQGPEWHAAQAAWAHLHNALGLV